MQHSPFSTHLFSLCSLLRDSSQRIFLFLQIFFFSHALLYVTLLHVTSLCNSPLLKLFFFLTFSFAWHFPYASFPFCNSFVTHSFAQHFPIQLFTFATLLFSRYAFLCVTLLYATLPFCNSFFSYDLLCVTLPYITLLFCNSPFFWSSPLRDSSLFNSPFWQIIFFLTLSFTWLFSMQLSPFCNSFFFSVRSPLRDSSQRIFPILQIFFFFFFLTLSFMWLFCMQLSHFCNSTFFLRSPLRESFWCNSPLLKLSFFFVMLSFT